MQSKVILIQGAMDIEVEYFINQLKTKKSRSIAGYEFHEGFIDELKVVISKTLIGSINSTIATTLGIINFNPDIVINQGIAGAHTAYIHTGDIILGEKCCNINAYSMPRMDKGQGSNPFEWEPSKHDQNVLGSNLELVDIIEKSLTSTSSKKIYRGTLGSGDVFNREIDRILWINKLFGNYCEDMESIGTYSVCNKFNIPCIGIRIISNNEILNEKLDEEQAIELQKILVSMLNNKAF